MNTKYIISLTTLIALTGALSYGAASNPNPETPIGSLALLYAEGSADQAPRILASLYRKELLELVLIGRKEAKRFPNLCQDAMRELFGQKEKFRQLLQQHNSNVQEALFDAARNDKAWTIDYLVQNGADVNAYLVQNGADVNATYQFRVTALMKAAHAGHEAVVAQLLAAGADVNAKKDGGHTPLMYAAQSGHEAVVAQLLAARADVNAKDDVGYTPLMYAAQSGHEAVVAQLLAAGADVNAKNDVGYTPLMYAAQSGHEAMVAQLIVAGADVNEKNSDGMTPLMYAAYEGHGAMVAQLIAAGANVDEKNNYGSTALNFAERAVTNRYNQASRDGACAVVDLLTRARSPLKTTWPKKIL